MASELRVPLYETEKLSAPTSVCVTGVTGYMAGPIVQRLLAMGHTVHGTCRAPENTETTKHLTALPGASERLKLFKADLLVPGSFDEAMTGCTLAIHTASPYIINVKPRDVRSRLIDPALKGTENVLAAVEKSGTITRVVITSSVAAVYPTPEFPQPAGKKYTEDHWNTVATEKVLPYFCSKTLAERRAWELAGAQTRWKLVVINPPAIYGPPLSSRADGESVEFVKKMAAGEMKAACPKIGMGYTDVRDIAAAHTMAAFHPNAQGRYVAVAGSAYLSELNNALADAFPGVVPRAGGPVPKWLLMLLGPFLGLPRDLVKYNVNECPHFDHSKTVNDFGLTFIPMSEMMVDQATAMSALGIIKKL